MCLENWSFFPLWGIKPENKKWKKKKNPKAYLSKLLCSSVWVLSVTGSSSLIKNAHCVVSQPCLFQTHSPLVPKPKSTFRELGFRGSALPSGSAFLIPSSRKRRKYLNAPPSLVEHPIVQVKLPNSCNCSSQTMGHLPMLSRLPSFGGHTATLFRYFTQSWEQYRSCIMTTAEYICVSGTLCSYWYSWNCAQSWCPRACHQAEPLYLLLGKLIFEKKYRISNLVQWNVIYRFELIPEFFFLNEYAFPTFVLRAHAELLNLHQAHPMD